MVGKLLCTCTLYLCDFRYNAQGRHIRRTHINIQGIQSDNAIVGGIHTGRNWKAVRGKRKRLSDDSVNTLGAFVLVVWIQTKKAQF